MRYINLLLTLAGYPHALNLRVRLPASRFRVATLGRLFTHVYASVTKQCNLMPCHGALMTEVTFPLLSEPKPVLD